MLTLEPFEYYLIVVNIIGFALFLINNLLYTYTENGQIDVVLTITSLLGGSLGIVLSMLIIDRKAIKGNMMSRVFVVCLLVIQIVFYLFLKGSPRQDISFGFFDFFSKNKTIFIYFLMINVVTFVMFAVDKYNAVTHRSRIRIVTLLALSFMGGSIGGLLAMYILRHKTKKDYFVVGLPMILFTQFIFIFYIMNV